MKLVTDENIGSGQDPVDTLRFLHQSLLFFFHRINFPGHKWTGRRQTLGTCGQHPVVTACREAGFKQRRESLAVEAADEPNSRAGGKGHDDAVMVRAFIVPKRFI